MNKKKWVKPALIVLVRKSKEETVFTACKYGPGNAAFAGGDCTCIFGVECEPCD